MSRESHVNRYGSDCQALLDYQCHSRLCVYTLFESTKASQLGVHIWLGVEVSTLMLSRCAHNSRSIRVGVAEDLEGTMAPPPNPT